MALMLINGLLEIFIRQDKIEINVKQKQVDEIELQAFSVEIKPKKNQSI